MIPEKVSCWAPDCTRQGVKHGLCETHNKRISRSGLLLRPVQRGPIPVPPEKRFFARVLIDKKTGCWLWQGQKMRNGYGRFSLNGVKPLAHRWCYERLIGPIPAKMTLDHRCANTLCVNPEHVEPVLNPENVRRMAARAAARKRERKERERGGYDHRTS